MKQACLGLWVCLALVCGPVSTEAGMTAKRTVLNNGMVLLTSEQRALPMVSIELLIDAGSRYEPADQAGLANLTSKLLIYGTKQRTAVQISDALDFIGASLEAGRGQDTTSVSLTVLKKDLTTGLELLADVLTQSTFPQAD
jgi:zinc protease